jgi:hypothetical protein
MSQKAKAMRGALTEGSLEKLRQENKRLRGEIDLLLCPMCDQGIRKGHAPDCHEDETETLKADLEEARWYAKKYREDAKKSNSTFHELLILKHKAVKKLEEARGLARWYYAWTGRQVAELKAANERIRGYQDLIKELNEDLGLQIQITTALQKK